MGLCYIPSLAHWTSQLFVGFSFRLVCRGWNTSLISWDINLSWFSSRFLKKMKQGDGMIMLATSNLRLKQALPRESEGPSGNLLQLTEAAAIGLEEAALSRDKEH
ncbi:hypothetical protein ERO13_A12G068550v2 [Gossypium hirsutum]|uniref:Uncharacterized protein n=4 Tax=Gossypium TaxID=3633 RepID=A0A5J5T733_GOSBA|nr:hypothetical protein ES319_A12G069700v1 [Gossypium barbadense]KAG4169148.1 hypothetical protein ERO13_A12G068550v2 [Gossypium hirsutum]TYG89129.1 hypothetical protein ES288_A12G075100v1 [Gossypium darwinii]TYH94981.1 hypothetical protein ES332_A12G076300v1 [Gossypium tomentosum]TYJ04115.1 hypothetical protein E1A91_A12G071900v1 [Gossypium mustelinum]